MQWILDVGCCTLDLGFLILDVEYWIFNGGDWIFDVGYWISDGGFGMLDVGYWIFDAGCLTCLSQHNGKGQRTNRWRRAIPRLGRTPNLFPVSEKKYLDLSDS